MPRHATHRRLMARVEPHVGVHSGREASSTPRWALILANAAFEKALTSLVPLLRLCRGRGGHDFLLWGIYIALVLQHLVSRDSFLTQPSFFLNPCMMRMCMMKVGQGASA